MKSFIAFCCLLISPVVLSLDEEYAKELPCIDSPPLAKNWDRNWSASVPEWYNPLWSKLELYRLASEVHGSPIYDIREDELYYDACFTTKLQKHYDSYIVMNHGFNGLTGASEIKGVCEDIFKFHLKHSKTGGHVYNTLTDNYTFVLFVTCWDDGQASWSVSSTTKTLDYKTTKQILDHVKSLGFKEKNIVRLRYDTCQSRKTRPTRPEYEY